MRINSRVLRWSVVLLLSLFVDGGIRAQAADPGSLPAAPAGRIKLTLYYVTDTAVSGCAVDTQDPAAALPVYVYTEGLAPVVSAAAYGCPWDTASNGHGFQIQYRQPLDEPSGVRVGVLTSDQSRAAWATDAQAKNRINNFNRSSQTFFFETLHYRVGISRRYGAMLAEYYNKRVDPSLNLITSDPGAALQTAYFGSANVVEGSNCVGITLNVYNPTQAGSGCPNGAGQQFIGSSLSDCTSSNNNSLCGQNSVFNRNPSDASPEWIQYLVHYRNYFYAAGVTDYQNYDDVYGYVKYTFKASYAQVDYQSWRTNDLDHGTSFQSMPIAFLNQVNVLRTDSVNLVRKGSDARNMGYVNQYGFTSGKAHWILALAENNDASVPMATPGDFVTLAFYSAIVGSAGKICPDRQVQAGFFGASSTTDQTWMGYANSGEIQNIFTGVVMQMNSYYQSRAILSPFRPTALVNGTTISQTLDTLDTQGGAMPAWECNQAGGGASAVATSSGGASSDTAASASGPAAPAVAPVVSTVAPTAPTKPMEALTPDSDALSVTMNGSPASPTLAAATASALVINPVYRFYNSVSQEHFFSLDATEGTRAGFRAEGVGFSVLGSRAPGTVPIYRCYIPGFKHFVSLDWGCEGMRKEGRFGFIYTTAKPFTAPLTRMYDTANLDHLTTENTAEGFASGYYLEQTMGYAY